MPEPDCMTYCSACGRQVGDNWKFCNTCGGTTVQRGAAGEAIPQGPTEIVWERLAVRGLGPASMVQRARVPGGWLVWVTERESLGGSNVMPGRSLLGPGTYQATVPVGLSGLTFLPDPSHSWGGV